MQYNVIHLEGYCSHIFYIKELYHVDNVKKIKIRKLNKNKNTNKRNRRKEKI